MILTAQNHTPFARDRGGALLKSARFGNYAHESSTCSDRSYNCARYGHFQI